MCKCGCRVRLGIDEFEEAKDSTILVDRCYKCGKYTSVQPMTLRQRNWLNDRNKEIHDFNVKEGISNCP